MAGIDDIDLEGLKDNAEGAKQTLKAISDVLKDIIKNNNTVASSFGASKSTLNGTVGLAKELSSLRTDAVPTENTLKKIQSLSTKSQKEARSLAVEINILNAKKINANRREKMVLDSIIQAKQEELHNTRELISESQQLLNLQENIEKKLGGMGLLVKGMNKIPIIGDVLETDKALAAMSKTAGKGGGKIKTMGAGLKSMGKSLAKAGPQILIMELVKALNQADQEVTELAKSFTMSKNEAAVFRSELATAASRSGDIFVTTSKLIEAQATLNKELGLTVQFGGETLIQATKLLEKTKLAGDAVAGLAAQSVVAGGSFEDNYENALSTAYEIQRASGRTVDLRGVMTQVGKVSGALRAQLGGSTIEIAKAVANAEDLGMNMEAVASAGRQLLDFESSITKELEAEVLLGKDLNLEKARAAALTGDQVTLQNELQKNVGTFTDFTKMNVLQQEALAAAMGMQSDQLSDILFKQEIQGKTAQQLRALGKDELADRLEATTAQDKFNKVIEKLQGILADIVTPLIPLLDTIMSVLDPIFSLLRLMNPTLKLTSLVVTAITDSIKSIASIFGIGEGGFEATMEAAGQYGDSIMNDTPLGLIFQNPSNNSGGSVSNNTQPVVIQNTFSNFQASGPYALAETQRRQASPTFA